MKKFIDFNNLPLHISIIMDGNRRWTNKRNISNFFGHYHSLKSIESVISGCISLNIQYLTFYAFSKQNWKRSKIETEYLIKLIIDTIWFNLKKLINNNIKIIVIGDVKKFSLEYQNKINFLSDISKNNKKLYLIILINYSGKWEIIRGLKLFFQDIKKKNISLNNINDKTFEKYLKSSKFPNLDLLIRTSNQFRISNFFLWQIAYTEMFFSKVLWPDFRKKNLYEAILNYQKRKRNFGK